EPYPYQKQGIAYAINKKRALIGDKPGLGKTLQAIGAVSYLNAFPCLVICPASLKLNWEKEWEKFSYHKAEVLNDSLKNTWPYINQAGLVDIFIVNYESLGKYFLLRTDNFGGKAKLSDMVFNPNIKLFKSIIIDESHRTKDPSTQQSKLVKALSVGKPVVYLLSGTPVVNDPQDLIPQLSILNMLGSFGGAKIFKDRYCTANYFRELHSKLRLNCFFSREKEEVLKDLPPKVRQIVPVEITTQEEYDLAVADLKTYLISYKNATAQQVKRALRAQILVSFGVLKEISARGKMEFATEYTKEIINSKEKIVIFCHLKLVAEELSKTFPNAVTILGKDNYIKRDYAVTEFQNNPSVTEIICSIKAAGVGLTLTASSIVLFMELPWTDADLTQCEDRCHRIGQKDSVQSIIPLGKGTIDEWIYYEVICGKRKMTQAITGAEYEITEEHIDSFFNFLKL
ncbi:MAG: DEAD/DEAH box helicase, partial [Bacteroidales bacterium]